MKILVTGAGGMTGKALVKSLKKHDVEIRVMVHRENQRESFLALGVTEAIAGDAMNPDDIRRAVKGIDKIYHICSTAHPQEDEIGLLIIDEAKRQHVVHFVYHSVLHSLFEDLPHHKRKQTVEKYLINSGIPYTILQPAALMQNLMMSRDNLLQEGVFLQKFFVSDKTRINLVNLDDVAEIASRILTESGFEYASYEICGPHNLSLTDMIASLENVLQHPVRPSFIPDDVFASQMRMAGRSEEVVNTLLAMFRHYNESGFMGNPQTAAFLLGRTPSTLGAYLKDAIWKR